MSRRSLLKITENKQRETAMIYLVIYFHVKYKVDMWVTMLSTSIKIDNKHSNISHELKRPHLIFSRRGSPVAGPDIYSLQSLVWCELS